jgi:hypothetical protein
MKIDTSEHRAKAAVGIDDFLIKKVIRPQKLNSLLRLEVYGASVATLRGHEVLNTILIDVREEDRCIL